MKIAVIVSDATHAVHVGGEVIRTVRQFDAPYELVEYIKKQTSDYVSISLAFVEDSP